MFTSRLVLPRVLICMFATIVKPPNMTGALLMTWGTLNYSPCQPTRVYLEYCQNQSLALPALPLNSAGVSPWALTMRNASAHFSEQSDHLVATLGRRSELAAKYKRPREAQREFALHLLTPAAASYHEARKALHQLSALQNRSCPPRSSSNDQLSYLEPSLLDLGPPRCHPTENTAYVMDRRPLDWAREAIAVPDPVSRVELLKRCTAALMCSLVDPEPNHAAIQITIDKLQKHAARGNNLGHGVDLSIAVSNLECSLLVLEKLFTAWAEAHCGSLAGLGKLKIFFLGYDDSVPSVASRNRFGFPLLVRNGGANGTGAWSNFAQWQKVESDLASNHEGLEGRWATCLIKWERQGLDATFLIANLVAEHPRFAPLPIGIKEIQLKEFKTFRNKTSDEAFSSPNSFLKTGLLMVNFKAFGGPSGSSERESLYRLVTLGHLKETDLQTGEHSSRAWHWASMIEKPPNRVGEGAWTSSEKLHLYYSQLMRHHFVLSPRGNGLDCYRTWEALALGVIPIIKRNGPFDRLYEGMPVLLVDRWEDVSLDLLLRTLKEWRHRRFGGLVRLRVESYFHSRMEGSILATLRSNLSIATAVYESKVSPELNCTYNSSFDNSSFSERTLQNVYEVFGMGRFQVNSSIGRRSRPRLIKDETPSEQSRRSLLGLSHLRAHGHDGKHIKKKDKSFVQNELLDPLQSPLEHVISIQVRLPYKVRSFRTKNRVLNTESDKLRFCKDLASGLYDLLGYEPLVVIESFGVNNLVCLKVASLTNTTDVLGVISAFQKDSAQFISTEKYGKSFLVDISATGHDGSRSKARDEVSSEVSSHS